MPLIHELSGREVTPFDLVYEDVTREMNAAADNRQPPDRDWLRRLINTFAAERQLWNDRRELDEYRRRWKGLRAQVLRLAAGAYLHVSYDLPRALANDWPGEGEWVAGPSRIRGYQVYFDLVPIFRGSLRRASRRWRCVGLLIPGTSVASMLMLGILNHWLLHLRTAAWNHAELLTQLSDRTSREAAMAEAMTAALQDVSDWFPWSYSALEPPHSAFRSPALAAIGSVSIWLPGVAALLALTLSAVTLVSGWRRLGFEYALFIDRLGWFVHDYVGFAIREPEGFPEYRARRRVELMGRPLGERSPL